MSDYRAEIERRIAQFRRYLEPMDRRAHEEARGSCFLIFENHQPDEDPGNLAGEHVCDGSAATVGEALRFSTCPPEAMR